MRDKFLVFGSPRIEQPEIDEVTQVLESGWLGTGPRVAEFETAFASYRGMPHAAGLFSCTAALHLGLLAAGVGPGDEVITTPLTFCATVNAVIHCGATPVLADIDPLTFNIDPSSVEAAITDQTKVILPVHFAGRPCDMTAICDIAQKHDLIIIEDSAHAIETEYKGQPVGSFGLFGCYSFYVTKNLAMGEGGMVLSHDEEKVNRIKQLALHGMSKDAWKRFGDNGFQHYDVVECGFKYNMMDLQAAIGLHQLDRIEEYWKIRRKIWRQYDEAFTNTPVVTPTPFDPADGRHGHHLYTLLINEEHAGISRDAFLAAMTERKVGVGVHYRSIPEHPYYKEQFGWKPEDWPNALAVGQQTISLPLSAKLTDIDVQDVIEAVHDVISSKAG